MVSTWNRAKAVELARMIEAVCPDYGCHVALTGGCLYKDHERKDVDFVFYRIRQRPSIDKQELFAALERTCGIVVKPGGFGWVHKATWHGHTMDLFFPEEDRVVTPSDNHRSGDH